VGDSRNFVVDVVGNL